MVVFVEMLLVLFGGGVGAFAKFAKYLKHFFVAHEPAFAVGCVLVFEFRVEAIKFCDDVALFSLFFPVFPTRMRFPVEVDHRPECPPDDGADAVPQGAPEYATTLPPKEV